MRVHAVVYTVITLAWVYLAGSISQRWFAGDRIAEVAVLVGLGSLAVTICLNMEFLVEHASAKLKAKKKDEPGTGA